MKITVNYEAIKLWHAVSSVFFEDSCFEDLTSIYAEMYGREYASFIVGEAILLHNSSEKYSNFSQLHCVKIVQKMIRREKSHNRKIDDIEADGIGNRERGKNVNRPSFVEDCNAFNLVSEKNYKGNGVIRNLSNGKKIRVTKKIVYSTDFNAVNARQSAYNRKEDITLNKLAISMALYEQNVLKYGAFCDTEQSIVRKYLIADVLNSFSDKALKAFNVAYHLWQEDKLDNNNSDYKTLKYYLRDWNVSVFNFFETYSVCYA